MQNHYFCGINASSEFTKNIFCVTTGVNKQVQQNEPRRVSTVIYLAAPAAQRPLLQHVFSNMRTVERKKRHQIKSKTRPLFSNRKDDSAAPLTVKNCGSVNS